MSVLCYVRPWNEEHFKIIAQNAFPADKVHYFSDFPKHGPFYFQEKLVKYFLNEQHQKYGIGHHSAISRTNKSTLPLMERARVSGADRKEIIARCRLLRNIEESVAEDLISACAISILSLLDELKPKFILSLTVDSYVTDLLSYFAAQKGIKYIGLVSFFINGYCRLTTKGEYIKIRSVSDEEVDLIYDRLIINQEKPTFINHYSSAKQIKKMWLKNATMGKLRHVYMRLQRMRSLSHKYCYHYWSSEIIAKEKKEKVNLKIFTSDFRETPSSCYVPLQYSPECTIDYWIKDPNEINYNQRLLEVLKLLSKLNLKIFVKEHPNCLGIRPRNFYKKILAIKNVILLSPLINAQKVIAGTDFTLVWTGTAGIEASLLGKPVVHLGNPYYIHNQAKFSKFSYDLFTIPQQTNNISSKEVKLFIKFLLEGNIKGTLIHKGKINSDANLRIIAAEIQNFISL